MLVCARAVVCTCVRVRSYDFILYTAWLVLQCGIGLLVLLQLPAAAIALGFVSVLPVVLYVQEKLPCYISTVVHINSATFSQ